MLNQAQNQSQSSKNRGTRMQSVNGNGASKQGSEESKSIGAFIGDSLGKDTQERVDQALEMVNEYFTDAKEYVSKHPKEVAGLAITVGVAAWALFYTKPGRQLFDKGAAVVVPEVSNWLTKTFSSQGSDRKQ